LIKPGEKVIVSVSGGVDSMVLLDLMIRLKSKMKFRIAIAHFNHQLRGRESDGDEALIRDYARKRKIQCFIESADTSAASDKEKLSIQETARNLRYDFLNKIRVSLGYDKIATAHNADDNSETMLFNLFRGSGLHGMKGIPLHRKDLQIVRPLLFATRESIAEYSAANGILFREDSSNLKSDYTRNFIRHQIIPLIRENINPNLSGSLFRAGRIFTDLESYLSRDLKKIMKETVRKKSKEGIILSRPKFLKLPYFLKEQLIIELLRVGFRTEIDYSAATLILKIADSGTGSHAPVRKDLIVMRDRNDIILKRWERPAAFLMPVKPSEKLISPGFTLEICRARRARFSSNRMVEYADGDLLGTELFVRSWHDGDWFIPFGMAKKKKLSDFFIDEKIPLLEKLSIPILESRGQIVWILGMRLDHRFRVTKKRRTLSNLNTNRRNKRR